jgi:hypothetical protein
VPAASFWRSGRLSDLPDPPFLNFTEEPKMTGMRSGLVLLTALLLLGSAAVAQQAGKPCADDIKTLCAGIQPGEGRIKAYIKSHLADCRQPAMTACSRWR